MTQQHCNPDQAGNPWQRPAHRMVSRSWRSVGLQLATLLCLAMPLQAMPLRQPGKIEVRLFVITMFVDETRPWLEREAWTRTLTVRGAHGPVHCTVNGLCVTETGMGKANVTASMTAILLDKRFDWDHAIMLTAGIAGARPDRLTLGGAGLARFSVDYDLGHHLLPSAPGEPLFLPTPFATGAESFQLDETLLQATFQAMQDITLADSPQAQAYKAHYPGQAGKPPALEICDTIAGDDYWHGAALSDLAARIVQERTGGQGTYCTTQMEDSAVALVMQRFGLLDRYMSLRTVSNFDQPYPGQSDQDSLAADSGGLPIATENAHRLGRALFDHLLRHPELPAGHDKGQLPVAH